MNKKLDKFLQQIIRILFYTFVFLLPWQTKLIIKPSDNNFTEISFFVSHIILLLLLMVFLLYRVIKKDYHSRSSVMWYSLAGLSLFAFLSFFFAPDKVLAFYMFIILMLGLGLFYFLQEGCKKFAYVDSVIEKSTTVFVFLTSIFFHVLLGIYQFLSQRAFAFKYLGLASHFPEDLGVSVIETSSGRWLRAYGGFDHPNIFAGVLIIAIILATYYLAKKKAIRTKTETIESLFLFIFYFFSLLALLFTFSRSAWVAFIIAFISLVILFIYKKDKWALGRLAALFLFSIILISTIFFSYRELFMMRIEASGRLEQISLDERKDQLATVSKVLKEKWFFGVGLGNYTTYLKNSDFDRNGIKKADWQYQPVHNSLFLLWVQSGLLALVFFITFLITLWKKSREEAFVWFLLLPLILLMFFDHWLLSLPFGVIFLFFILGIF